MLVNDHGTSSVLSFQHLIYMLSCQPDMMIKLSHTA